jgi:hypothetical protein
MTNGKALVLAAGKLSTTDFFTWSAQPIATLKIN